MAHIEAKIVLSRSLWLLFKIYQLFVLTFIWYSSMLKLWDHVLW